MMRNKSLSSSFVLASFIAALAIAGPAQVADAQTALSVGDVVQTGVNGQPVIGEVTAANGATVDLNLGQNNTSRFVSIANVKVVQKAGTGGKASCAVGDVVQVPYLANTVMTGRLMKTNGAYCEIDSSGSGFTGWSKCADIRRMSNGASCGPVETAAAGGRGTAASRSGAAPPKPGLTSCAGKFEGRYSPSTGLLGLTIVFRSGKATLSGPLSDDEEFECWTGDGKIVLHKAGTDDLNIDINNDGTLDTPLGELKKKGN